MTLRMRIAAVAAAAVALAVIGAATVVYVATRAGLRGQVDASLSQRADTLLGRSGDDVTLVTGSALLRGARTGAGTTGVLRLRSQGKSSSGSGSSDGEGVFVERVPRTVAPVRFGAASGYVQFVAPSGAIDVPGGQGPSPTISVTPKEKAIAARGRGRSWSDRTVRGVHLRVLTEGAAASRGERPKAGAIMVARPLTEVDHELTNILLILLATTLAGIALAGALGALGARAALRPIVRFTRRAETLAGGLDVSRRLDVRGRDELARLATSFNAKLDELERSIEAQRQLIADASHELRTPIATLRANVQTLEHAARLPESEQQSLRNDIVDELDELTRLVSDVVELARGAIPEAEWREVHVHDLVAEAAARARRRGDQFFELDVEPTFVRGDAEAIGRAVTNLLDNARKWSPSGGAVEVTLRDGELSVRDHGAGFRDADLPRVFERFYRAERARRMPGSGLGLAIVRQAAEAHRGFAIAENAAGGGARLRVSFGPPLRRVREREPSGTFAA